MYNIKDMRVLGRKMMEEKILAATATAEEPAPVEESVPEPVVEDKAEPVAEASARTVVTAKPKIVTFKRGQHGGIVAKIFTPDAYTAGVMEDHPEQFPTVEIEEGVMEPADELPPKTLVTADQIQVNDGVVVATPADVIPDVPVVHVRTRTRMAITNEPAIADDEA